MKCINILKYFICHMCNSGIYSNIYKKKIMKSDTTDLAITEAKMDNEF